MNNEVEKIIDKLDNVTEQLPDDVLRNRILFIIEKLQIMKNNIKTREPTVLPTKQPTESPNS